MALNETQHISKKGGFPDRDVNTWLAPRQSDQEDRTGRSGEPRRTGTTITAICTEDAVVMGSDRRASLGGKLVTSKEFDKLFQIHPTATLAITGGVGGNQRFAKMLRAEASLYKHRRETPMSIHALSTVAGNILSQHAFHAAPLLGGVDNTGTHLVSLDPAGGILEHEYTANGSGMQFALGVLEQQFAPKLSVESAKQITAQSIDSASERDTASGNGLKLATVTTDGVEFDTYESLSEAV